MIQTKVYNRVQKGILLLWGMFGIFLIGSLFLNSTNTAFLNVLVEFPFIAIIIGTSMPVEVKNQVSLEVSSQFEEKSSALAHVPLIDNTKIGHFVFFRCSV